MRYIRIDANLSEQAKANDTRFYIEYSVTGYINDSFTHWNFGIDKPQVILANPEKTKDDKYWRTIFDRDHGSNKCVTASGFNRMCMSIYQYVKNPNFKPEQWDPIHPSSWNTEYYLKFLRHLHFENPIIGRPWMTYSGDDGDTFCYSEGETWNSNIGVPISVHRNDDSDDYKEFVVNLG
jgi:hypothetical protein